MKSKSKLLITGANGFTGQHACNHFSKQGIDVIAVVRNKNNAKINNVKVECCDLTNQTSVKELIYKVKPEYILHLAGQNHVKESWVNPIMIMEANVMSSLYLLDALRTEHPSCKVVIVGSALQYDILQDKYPPHPYSLSKTLQSLVSESWSKLYNLDIIIAHPNNLIGPGHSKGVCSLIAQEIVKTENEMPAKPITISDPCIHRDFLDVRDAVKAYETLFKYGNNNEIYKIASGKSHSLGQLVSKYQSLSPKEVPVTVNKSNTKEAPIRVDVSKMKALGWVPGISFETSLKDILTFYRQLEDQKD
ncbi:NAD-dependent epimerase/dehydratase family protein [Alteribacillus bidgolensis]|uniref:GDP-4-dehydro-6-deoxy-D-mannose reductase n=1 Tax=Alteribacillus bidgolensis TaxID=930129 RepID=A0A1G8I2R3_9BACI|nr:NAD-dependent epimerase/dehydratase family protein [Alteribacillus bidgolensis]SDI13157.1 GDP-4-dehydro-6-deoxy-D-mannose reductase [Alteribacillus bidgolensis]